MSKKHRNRNRFVKQIRENPTQEEIEEIMKTEEQADEMPGSDKPVQEVRSIQRRQEGGLSTVRRQPALPE
jgi:hypothetical protein